MAERASWRRKIFDSLRCTALDTAPATSIYLEDDKSYEAIDAPNLPDAFTAVVQRPEKPGECDPEKPSTTQKALVVARMGVYEIREDFPTPRIESGNEVMIKTVAVGLNPIDWKSVDYNFCLPKFPWITGREMAGVVIEVGDEVENVSPGMRVWTSTYYKDIRAGCFQEYVVAPYHTVSRIPPSVSFEEAACLGVAGLTACMTLHRWLGVPMSSTGLPVTDERDWLLIWGGSTVTGQFATQLAVYSGLKVITVNSLATSDLSKSLGAAHVVVRDGKTNQGILEEIRAITEGRIPRAIDIVGPSTAATTLQAVSSASAVEFAPLAMMAADQAVPINVTAHTVEMKRFILDPQSQKYSEQLNLLLDSAVLAFPELDIMEGGCSSIIEGLERLKAGNMGGKKIIVKF